MNDKIYPPAIANSAVLNIAPGANLSAYVQSVSGIAVLSLDREQVLAERLFYHDCVDRANALESLKRRAPLRASSSYLPFLKIHEVLKYQFPLPQQ